MVENIRGVDKEPKERLAVINAEFDALFNVAGRNNPQSHWMHALSDLCDYYESIVNKIIEGQKVEKKGNSKDSHIDEDGLLSFINRKGFGNDEYGLAHKELFRKSASLLHAYEALYMGKGSIVKTRRFLVNKKNTILKEFRKLNEPNK